MTKSKTYYEKNLNAEASRVIARPLQISGKRHIQDPVALKAAKDFTNGLIAAAIGGKPSAKFDKLLKQYNSWTTNEEKKVYEFMSRITRSMEDLYGDFGRYIEAIQYDEQAEKEKGAKLTYYRADDDARRVAAAAGRIMKGKF